MMPNTSTNLMNQHAVVRSAVIGHIPIWSVTFIRVILLSRKTAVHVNLVPMAKCAVQVNFPLMIVILSSDSGRAVLIVNVKLVLMNAMFAMSHSIIAINPFPTLITELWRAVSNRRVFIHNLRAYRA